MFLQLWIKRLILVLITTKVKGKNFCTPRIRQRTLPTKRVKPHGFHPWPNSKPSCVGLWHFDEYFSNLPGSWLAAKTFCSSCFLSNTLIAFSLVFIFFFLTESPMYFHHYYCLSKSILLVNRILFNFDVEFLLFLRCVYWRIAGADASIHVGFSLSYFSIVLKITEADASIHVGISFINFSTFQIFSSFFTRSS